MLHTPSIHGHPWGHLSCGSRDRVWDNLMADSGQSLHLQAIKINLRSIARFSRSKREWTRRRRRLRWWHIKCHVYGSLRRDSVSSLSADIKNVKFQKWRFFFKESRRHVARHRNVSKWRTTCLKQRVNRRSWPFGFDAPSPCQSPVSWAWRSEYLSRNRKLGSSALRLFLWTGLRCGTSSLNLSALMFGPFGCQKLISFAKLIWFRHGTGFRIIRTYIMTKAYWVH